MGLSSIGFNAYPPTHEKPFSHRDRYFLSATQEIDGARDVSFFFF